MFTWTCPKCGGDVPPAYDDCPRCSPPKRADSPAAVRDATRDAETPASPPPEPSRTVARDAPPPPVYAAPEPPPLDSAEPPPRRAVAYAPPEKKGLSPTLVGLLAGLGIAALLAVLYLYVLPREGANKAETTEKAALEAPAAAGSAGRPHPLAKHLEVTGVRLKDFKNGKATIQFVVVNHSAASLPEMTMDVKIVSGGRTFFEIPAKLPSLGPYEVKDLSSAVSTELKSYEMPDWQMIRPQFSLRSE